MRRMAVDEVGSMLGTFVPPERIVDVGRREGWTIVSTLNDWSDGFGTREAKE